jgi:predicted transcriptional regulator
LIRRDIPDDVRQFIFDSIDSVEQLEILLLLSANPSRKWEAQAISAELRSTKTSVENRVESLVALNLVASDKEGYQFSPKNEADAKVVAQLPEIYKIMRHSILELIFSPMKKARAFANAFRVKNRTDKTGDDNG